ncbi:cupredoxin domain-containing protein [Neobacillus sp. PS3-40]|uniref:cupredoxin domain-containing protein n=1 Tax=Neobacillus sp. PS3-40 TaxID=3070679 RepID=UPI0027DFFCAD|nr:cupredoxin domain-containing protein [Neobacillus sp. PS3-40]WML44126.1 cupredoxin domain-containing protein [Neobacillus sp. PS3-40]
MNILSIITIAVVVLMTGYSIFLVHQHKNILNTMSGMMIAMAVAMMTGLLSGYFVGILSVDMFLAVGVGIITGFILGFLTGQPIGIIPVLIGALSGLMSGIIGAILGSFLVIESPFIMLGILLGLFIIIMGFVILFIKVEANEKLTLDTASISPFTILSVGIVLISLLLFLYSSDFIKITDTQTTSQAQTNGATETTEAPVTELDVTKESAPKIKMDVTPTGYTPNLIHVKKGVPVILEIQNPLKDSCLSTFKMPDFNINNVDLKVNETTKLTFTPSKAGEYSFSCGMNMFGGKIIVE